MTYKVKLIYFRSTGKFLTTAETNIAREEITKIWDEVDELRRLGRLPGLRPNAGRDLFVLIDVPDHPQRVPHLVMPPFFDEDDVTRPHIPTGELVPLIRIPLEEITRTTTRDVIKADPDPDVDTIITDTDDETTPVGATIPKPPDKP